MGSRRNRFKRRFAGPVVAQAAVDGFLDRKFDSYEWIKRATRAELEELLRPLPFCVGDDPDTGAEREPYLHQLACAVIASEMPDFLFFLDMGAGKTAVTFHVYRWHRKFNGLRRLLVCVPKAVNVQSWIDEAEIHAPDLRVMGLLGNAKQRYKLLQKSADIYVINYAGLQTYMTSLQEVKRKRGGAKKRKRVIDDKAARKFIDRFNGVVFDESHRIGNHMALVYHECRRFTKAYRIRYALTGTPFGRDPQKLWAQFHCVDNGKTFGHSVGLFRAAFYNAVEKPWAIEYNFDQRMDKQMRVMLQNRSIYYAENEYAGMRPVSRIPVPVRFSLSASEQYQAVLQRVRESRGDADELQSAYLRQRMVTSGFLSVKSELGGRLTLEFDENPKLDMLEELLTDMPESSKALVFHDYVYTGDMIGKRLRKIGIGYSRLGGGATEDPMVAYRKFLREKDRRVLIANNESGGTGINPQRVCNYLFFYESPPDPITRKQAERRVDRPGQKKKVFIYDLVVKNSVDERILKWLKKGENLFAAVCGGGRKAVEALQ